MNRKRILLIVLILIIGYSGLYFYKVIRYKYYDSRHQFGGEDTYILNKFFEKHQVFPESANELKKFIVDNNDLFVGNVMVDYLTKYDFHIKYDEEIGQYSVYENGLNYRDDGMEFESKSSNTNFFNFLFVKGDVLLFYSKNISKESVSLDRKIELPKNVTITTDSI